MFMASILVQGASGGFMLLLLLLPITPPTPFATDGK